MPTEQEERWFDKKAGYHYRATKTFNDDGQLIRDNLKRKEDSFFPKSWETVKDVSITTTKKK